MITTKKGKEGRNRITFSSMTTLSTLPSKFDIWTDPVEAALIDNEAKINGGVPPVYIGKENSSLTYFPR